MESSVQELIAATQNAEKDLRLIIAEMRGDGNGIAPRILIDGWANELERIYIALGSVNSFPLRNCDVGTAEEQAKRCFAYCNQQICKDCPCNTIGRCTLIWSQMPYEADDPAVDQLRYKMESEAAHGND